MGRSIPVSPSTSSNQIIALRLSLLIRHRTSSCRLFPFQNSSTGSHPARPRNQLSLRHICIGKSSSTSQRLCVRVCVMRRLQTSCLNLSALNSFRSCLVDDLRQRNTLPSSLTGPLVELQDVPARSNSPKPSV